MNSLQGYEAYGINDDGTIIGLKGKPLYGGITAGYRNVAVRHRANTKPTNEYVHRLVALKYLPNPTDLPEINHIDGNKLNNHVTNLEWCTHTGNMKHAYSTGLISNVGRLHPSALLTEDDVYSIFALRGAGYTQAVIAELFPVATVTVGNILAGRTWKHLQSERQ